MFNLILNPEPDAINPEHKLSLEEPLCTESLSCGFEKFEASGSVHGSIARVGGLASAASSLLIRASRAKARTAEARQLLTATSLQLEMLET